jgi:hypothetical protein
VELRPIVVQEPTARALGLHDGQVVQAVVEARQGQLKLTLNGQPLDAPLATFLREGEKLSLKAQLNASGQMTLTYTSPIPPSQALLQEKAQLPIALSAMLRQPALFGNWMRLLSPNVLQAIFPSTDSALLQSFLASQLTMSDLKPQSLRDWALKSGKSAESSLSKNEPVDGDLKTLLKSLLGPDDDSQSDGQQRQQQGRQSDGSSQAHTMIRQALDEVEASQLRAVQDWQQRGDINLAFVIPFRDAHPVKLHFERRANKKGQPQNPMIINMHTDSPVLGEIWLKSSISEQVNQVDLTMWALRSDVAQQASERFPELVYEIEHCGLRMGNFQVFNAPRPSIEVRSDGPDQGGVIDAKA